MLHSNKILKTEKKNERKVNTCENDFQSNKITMILKLTQLKYLTITILIKDHPFSISIFQ